MAGLGLQRETLRELLAQVSLSAARDSIIMGELPSASKQEAEELLAEQAVLSRVIPFSHPDAECGLWNGCSPQVRTLIGRKISPSFVTSPCSGMGSICRALSLFWWRFFLLSWGASPGTQMERGCMCVSHTTSNTLMNQLTIRVLLMCAITHNSSHVFSLLLVNMPHCNGLLCHVIVSTPRAYGGTEACCGVVDRWRLQNLGGSSLGSTNSFRQHRWTPIMHMSRRQRRQTKTSSTTSHEPQTEI